MKAVIFTIIFILFHIQFVAHEYILNNFNFLISVLFHTVWNIILVVFIDKKIIKLKDIKIKLKNIVIILKSSNWGSKKENLNKIFICFIVSFVMVSILFIYDIVIKNILL